MLLAQKPKTRTAIVAALAVAMAGATMAPPAMAQGGDITKGAIIGLATGAIATHLYDTRRAPRQTYYYAPAQRERVYYSQPTVRYSAPSSPVSRAFYSQDPQVRRSIQAALAQDGYYNSSIDGAWGPGTQDAIYQYARSHNQMSMMTTESDANQLFSQILR